MTSVSGYTASSVMYCCNSCTGVARCSCCGARVFSGEGGAEHMRSEHMRSGIGGTIRSGFDASPCLYGNTRGDSRGDGAVLFEKIRVCEGKGGWGGWFGCLLKFMEFVQTDWWM